MAFTARVCVMYMHNDIEPNKPVAHLSSSSLIYVHYRVGFISDSSSTSRADRDKSCLPSLFQRARLGDLERALYSDGVPS